MRTPISRAAGVACRTTDRELVALRCDDRRRTPATAPTAGQSRLIAPPPGGLAAVGGAPEGPICARQVRSTSDSAREKGVPIWETHEARRDSSSVLGGQVGHRVTIATAGPSAAPSRFPPWIFRMRTRLNAPA